MSDLAPGTVTQLKDANSEPVADVVEQLEDALVLARSGELRTVTIVGALTGNDILTAWATEDVIPMVGELEHLKYKLLKALPTKEEK